MINIQNKVDCCGCNACGDVCAHKAITFKIDNEEFRNIGKTGDI